MILEQDELWVTAEDVELRLDEMGESHLANTLAMLERNASNLAWAQAERYWAWYINHDGGEMAEDGLRRDAEGFSEWLYSASKGEKLGWLDRKPLMIKIRALLRAMPSDTRSFLDGFKVAV